MKMKYSFKQVISYALIVIVVFLIMLCYDVSL